MQSRFVQVIAERRVERAKQLLDVEQPQWCAEWNWVFVREAS